MATVRNSAKNIQGTPGTPRRCSFMVMLPHVVDRCIVSRAIPRIRLPRHPSHRIALGRPVGQLNGAKENSIHNLHTKHTTTPSTARAHPSLYLSHTVQARHLDQQISRMGARYPLLTSPTMDCKSLRSTSKCNMSSSFRVTGLMKSVTLDEEKSLCGRRKVLSGQCGCLKKRILQGGEGVSVLEGSPEMAFTRRPDRFGRPGRVF